MQPGTRVAPPARTNPTTVPPKKTGRSLSLGVALWQDLRFGVRSLGKNISVTLGAVGSLGAGIGAASTIFTWLNTTVLNPLPGVPD